MKYPLKIEHLKKSYRHSVVLDDVNLKVPKGNIFGLIGPNGSGKSTLIGILTGLLDFDEGSIQVNGLPHTEENELQIKQQVASVLQPPLLFEHFTADDFLHYVCDMYAVPEGERQQKINSLLRYLDLKEFQKVKINKLSAGSRKKLSICGAVITEPRILFLDEPFESIDVISISRIKTILSQLQEKGVTIIITSHILEIVENLCDDIAILHNKEIVAYLDSQSRQELQQDADLSEIFESYMDIEEPSSDILKWI